MRTVRVCCDAYLPRGPVSTRAPRVPLQGPVRTASARFPCDMGDAVPQPGAIGQVARGALFRRGFHRGRRDEPVGILARAAATEARGRRAPRQGVYPWVSSHCIALFVACASCRWCMGRAWCVVSLKRHVRRLSRRRAAKQKLSQTDRSTHSLHSAYVKFVRATPPPPRPPALAPPPQAPLLQCCQSNP